MRPIVFMGDSLDQLRSFPSEAKLRAGFELREVQKGREPRDWKPMKSVGSGVREIRLRTAFGAFRVIYVLVDGPEVLVLHAFQKKTSKTAVRDLAIATDRLRSWRG